MIKRMIGIVLALALVFASLGVFALSAAAETAGETAADEELIPTDEAPADSGAGFINTKYYSVRYDANGGIGAMVATLVKEGDYITLRECTIRPPEGMSFLKWDLGYPGDSIKITQDTVIKAIWSGEALYKLGDVDADGSVSVMDASRIQKYKAKLCELDGSRYVGGLLPIYQRKLVVDVDKDGDITVMDATAIQKHLAGIKTIYGMGQAVW